MSIDDRKINLLRTMASGFSACGRTTGHGESCTPGWLCGACEKRKEISDGVMEICADIVQLNAELECARGDLKTAMEIVERNQKDADRYRWIKKEGYDIGSYHSGNGKPWFEDLTEQSIDEEIAKERT